MKPVKFFVYMLCLLLVSSLQPVSASFQQNGFNYTHLVSVRSSSSVLYSIRHNLPAISNVVVDVAQPGLFTDLDEDEDNDDTQHKRSKLPVRNSTAYSFASYPSISYYFSTGFVLHAPVCINTYPRYILLGVLRV